MKKFLYPIIFFLMFVNNLSSHGVERLAKYFGIFVPKIIFIYDNNSFRDLGVSFEFTIPINYQYYYYHRSKNDSIHEYQKMIMFSQWTGSLFVTDKSAQTLKLNYAPMVSFRIKDDLYLNIGVPLGIFADNEFNYGLTSGYRIDLGDYDYSFSIIYHYNYSLKYKSFLNHTIQLGITTYW